MRRRPIDAICGASASTSLQETAIWCRALPQPSNGPALGCRPPLSVPGTLRRPPGESTPDLGGRPAGRPGKTTGGDRSALEIC